MVHKPRWHGLTVVVLVISLFGTHHVFANDQDPFVPGTEAKPFRQPDDGGEFRPQVTQELTPQQYTEIQGRLARNTALLQANGTISSPLSPEDVPFIWPLRQADSSSDFGYHAVSGYVDHNPNFPDALTDYTCGNRSYDLGSGYNHKGTDYFSWPFSWSKMDNYTVEIVAAADGVILEKDDGNFDRSCGFGGGSWNAVYLLHADGSVSWYGHMKNGSLTTKPIGASVTAGEFLGVMGSSGNSTGPHLHFEVYDADNNLIDPYAGACNPTIASSRWQAQRPYYDSAINMLTTGSSPAVFPSCPNPETSNEDQYFQPGDQIVFAAYYRDQRHNQQSDYTVSRPDGSVFSSWSHSSPAEHYSASWWYWTRTPGGGSPTGTWRWAVTFDGTSYRYPFFLGTPSPAAGPTVTVSTNSAQDMLNFDWTDVNANCNYEVHRSTTDPYFNAEGDTMLTTLADGSNTYSDAIAVGNPAVNATYLLRAHNCNDSSTADSNRIGEFDFALTPGIAPNYHAQDSDDAGGPAYRFEDISDSGTDVALGDDDSLLVPVGFSFDFYGTAFTNVYIGSNGFLAFDGTGTSSGSYTPSEIPNISTPNSLIAGWWEDLNPALGGTILYETLGSAPNRRLIVQFLDVQHYPGGNPITMQFKLFEGSDSIEVHYQTVPSDGGNHAAGIENAHSTSGVSYFWGNASLPDDLAVRYQIN